MWRSSAWSLLAWVVLLPQADAGPNESKQGAITEPGFGRLLLPLDAGWRFQRGEPDDAKGTDLDDAEWEEITLPYTFNGADGEWCASLAALGKKKAIATVEHQTRAQASGPDLHYLFAPIKRARSNAASAKLGSLRCV